MGAKPSRIRFDKIDGFIKIYDRTRYLISFDSERYDAIYDRIRYLIKEKRGITYNISYNFARIRIYQYNSLPLEKTLNFHNDLILIKSVVIKNKNNCYYNMILEKGSYEDNYKRVKRVRYWSKLVFFK